MNKLTKSGALIVVVTAMLCGACKKEVNDAPQADSANPAASTSGIEANAGYRPEILGSIKEPKGVYNTFDFGAAPPFDYSKIYSVPMADVGTITVVLNQKKFVYRLSNSDEVFANISPTGVPQQIAMLFNYEATITGVDKAQNSQITIRLFSRGETYYSLYEVSFKFDGLDAPGADPSVVEYSSFYTPILSFGASLYVEKFNGKVKTRGVFYGKLGYRAGKWTSKSDFVVQGSFNIEPPKI